MRVELSGDLMNRRLFLRSLVPAALVIPAVVSPLNPLAAAAKSSTDSFEYNFKAGVLSAVQQWQARYTRGEGGELLSTTFDVFESERNAKSAFKQFAKYLDDYFEWSMDSDAGIEEQKREKVAPPRLGARRAAQLSTIWIGSVQIEAMMTVMFVQKGAILHKWQSIGLVNPSEELFDIADKTMGFAELDDDSDDDEVLALLPTAKDMPRALSLVIEDVARF